MPYDGGGGSRNTSHYHAIGHVIGKLVALREATAPVRNGRFVKARHSVKPRRALIRSSGCGVIRPPAACSANWSSERNLIRVLDVDACNTSAGREVVY